MDLESRTVEYTHRYSGKVGVWGYWVSSEKEIFEFLGEDELYPEYDLRERIHNFVVYQKVKRLLIRRYLLKR